MPYRHAVADPAPFDTRLAAYGVIVEDAHVLLAFWNGEGRRAGAWTLPGGGADLHERPEQTLAREVLEETGFTVEPVRLLGVDTHVIEPHSRIRSQDPRPLKAVRVVFEARITGGELRHEVGGSTDEARWVPLADVPTLERVSLVDIGLGFAALG